jgi:hypothetical protein
MTQPAPRPAYHAMKAIPVGIACVLVGQLFGDSIARATGLGVLGWLIVAIVVLVGGIGGFAAWRMRGNVPVSPASLETSLAALHAPPRPGQALVFVWRAAGGGARVGLDVEVDGVRTHQTRGGGFVRLDLAPGERRLGCRHAEAPELLLRLHAGDSVIVEQVLGTSARLAATYRVTPPEAAGAAVRDARLLPPLA